jgi:hypothetical protein
MIFDAQRAVGLNLLGSPKDLAAYEVGKTAGASLAINPGISET